MKPPNTLFLLLCLWAAVLLPSISAGNAPSNLKSADNTDIPGTVLRLDGENVLISQDGSESSVAFADLHQESKIEVLKWALPLIMDNPAFVEFRFQPLTGEKRYQTYIRCTIENKSPVALPAELDLDYNLYLLTFRGKSLEFDGGYELQQGFKYTFEQSGAKTLAYKTDFDGLTPGQSYHFDTPVDLKLRTFAMSWAAVLPGNHHTFKPPSVPDRNDSNRVAMEQYYGMPSRMRNSAETYRSAMEMRFQLDGETVYTYLTPENAAPLVKDLWTEPFLPYYTDAQKLAMEQEKAAQQTTGVAVAPVDSPAAAPVDSSLKPEQLTLKDGSTLSAHIDEIVGQDIFYYDLDSGDRLKIAYDELSAESLRQLMHWLVQDLVAKKQLSVKIRYEPTKTMGEDRELGEYKVSVQNVSKATLPEDFAVDCRQYRLGYTLNSAGDYFYYKLSSFVEQGFPDINGPLKENETLEVSSGPQIINKPPYDWSRLSGTTFLLNGQAATASVYLVAVEARLTYDGQVYDTEFTPSQAEVPVNERRVPELSEVAATPEAVAPKRTEPEPVAEPVVQTAPAPADDSPSIPYNSIVIIEVDGGVGTGFLMEIKGRKFLVTNTHVVAGSENIKAETLNGDDISLPAQFYIAKDRDLAIFPINHDGDYLSLVEQLTENVKIGDSVTVFGNEAGASVATKLTGAINGVGPDRIEIDAKFVEGNSGSPAIHHTTGQVIGLATFYIEYEIPKADLRDDDKRRDDPSYRSPEAENEPSKSEVAEGKKRRRFAERIDNVSEWDATTLRGLKAQADALQRYEDALSGALQVAIGINQRGIVIQPSEAPASMEYLLQDFHKYYNANRQAGSIGNQRALEEFKKKLINAMENERRFAKRELSIKYFHDQHERLTALEKQLTEYIGGVYTY